MLKFYLSLAALIAATAYPMTANAQNANTLDREIAPAPTTEADITTVDSGDIITLPDGTKLLDGKSFTVLIEGKGRDVVLIPGLSTPRAVWDATRAQLKGKYRLHIVQVRGFGDAAGVNAIGPVFEKFVFEIADYIDDEITEKNGNIKPYVIGHSLGGLTAIKLASAYPHEVERVMVVDSLPFFGMIFGPGATVEAMEPQAAMMRDAIAAQDSYTADARTLQTMSISEEGRAQVAEWAATASPKATANFLYDLMTTDIRGELADITVPVTMLYPLDENVMPAARVDALYGAAFADATSFTLRRIDDSRHFIMLDNPEAFADAVEAFLMDSSEE